MRTLIKRAAIAAHNHGLIGSGMTAFVFRIFRLRDA
jgi:hypothetical protein